MGLLLSRLLSSDAQQNIDLDLCEEGKGRAGKERRRGGREGRDEPRSIPTRLRRRRSRPCLLRRTSDCYITTRTHPTVSSRPNTLKTHIEKKEGKEANDAKATDNSEKEVREPRRQVKRKVGKDALATPLTSSTRIESFQHNVHNPLTGEDVPAADCGCGGGV